MIGLGVAKLFVSFHVASWDRADYRRSGTLEWECRPRLLTPSCGWVSIGVRLYSMPKHNPEIPDGGWPGREGTWQRHALSEPSRRSIPKVDTGTNVRALAKQVLSPLDGISRPRQC